MRNLLLSLLSFCALVCAATLADAQNCDDADPALALKNIVGDSEYTIDPDDPKQNLIYVNHGHDGRSKVVVAHLDGRSGQVIPGSVTTIANNFYGIKEINGPEFVRPPGAGLGILYRDADGVHGAFRAAKPRAWNDFSLDVYGAPYGNNPPRLRSSYIGSYNGSGALNLDTYSLVFGRCSDRCFANMRWGVPTDVSAVLARQGLIVQPHWLVQGVEGGTVFVKACIRARNRSCGIYEATIDGAGGIFADTLRKQASLPPDLGPFDAIHPMAIARHPVTGSNVLFIAAAHGSGRTIDVYEQSSPGAALTLIGSVPTIADHFRVIDDGHLLLLHFVIFHVSYRGSYSLTVEATQNHLVLGLPKMISTFGASAEVVFLPAAGRFAIFYVSPVQPYTLQRCFFQP